MDSRAATESDEDLVRRCQAGDTQAFGELVERHERSTYRYVYRLVRNHEDARDVTQEAFVSAYRFIGRFRQDGRFTAWLFSIASRVCVSWLRRTRRHREGRVEWDESVSGSSDGAAGPGLRDRTLERWDLVRQIERAVARLPVAYRQVVALRYGEDLSCKEIAQVLRITPGAVRTRLFRAHKALRRHLGQEQESDGQAPSPGRVAGDEL